LKSIQELFPRGLIVSCQALEDEPLHGSDIMACMAAAAEMSGAVGIRANTPEDIRAIRAAVRLPIVGIYKQAHSGFDVFITPTFADAQTVAKAGADMIALDATARPRPEGDSVADLIRRIHDGLDLPVMADISTEDEALAAAAAGADAVSTTLSGYTPYSSRAQGPDFDLIRRLAGKLSVPLVAEGRFYYPDDAARAIVLGCHAVVVGGAITRPQEIAKRFVDRLAPLL
jgi:N-acylglucosamine-6-phosphate 2-epimerase